MATVKEVLKSQTAQANRERVVNAKGKKEDHSPRSGTQAVSGKTADTPSDDSGNALVQYSQDDAAVRVQEAAAVVTQSTLVFITRCVVYVISVVYGPKGKRGSRDDAWKNVEKWTSERGVRYSQLRGIASTANDLTAHMLKTFQMGGIIGQIIASKDAAGAADLLLADLKANGVSSFNTLRQYAKMEVIWTDDKVKDDAAKAALKAKGVTPQAKAARKRKIEKKRQDTAIEVISAKPEAMATAMIRVGREDDGADKVIKAVATFIETVGSLDVLESLKELITERETTLRAELANQPAPVKESPAASTTH